MTTKTVDRLSGSHNGRAKLSWEIVDEIRQNYPDGIPFYEGAEVARKYGVSQSTVSDVARGKTWREETRPK